jgi:hypothetical protein
MTLDRYDCLEAFPKLSSEKGKIAKATSAVFGRVSEFKKFLGYQAKVFTLSIFFLRFFS